MNRTEVRRWLHRGTGTVVALTMLAPTASGAAAIGEVPERAFRGGLLASVTRADVDDPDGSTDAQTYLRLALVGTGRLDARHRLLGEIFYHRFDLDAGVSKIGQDVTRLGAALSYQTQWTTGPTRPWAGIGVAYARNEYQQRFTVASDGFLDRRFPDRQENGVSLLLNFTTQTAWTRGWDIGLHLQYEQPVSADLRTVSVGVLLFF